MDISLRAINGQLVQVIDWVPPVAVGDHTVSTFRMQVEQHNARLRRAEPVSPAKVAAAYQEHKA